MKVKELVQKLLVLNQDLDIEFHMDTNELLDEYRYTIKFSGDVKEESLYQVNDELTMGYDDAYQELEGCLDDGEMHDDDLEDLINKKLEEIERKSAVFTVN